VDLVPLQFYCNNNSDMGSDKKNTPRVVYVEMSLHYTSCLFCIMA